MRKCRRGLAAIMALLLMIPVQPAMAARQSPPERLEVEETATPGNAKKEPETVKKKVSNLDNAETDKEKSEREDRATPANAQKTRTAVKISAAKEEIIFNTGNHEYSVVSEKDFLETGSGDAFFEDDGSYTINIPEENPFFPYEVEFTVQGKHTKHWFMTPDDQVEVGGHIFYVSAYFDGTAVTQMSLNVGGNTIIVYPEKKKFTHDEEAGAEPESLLPLERRNLEVDLSAFTPAELTMVSVNEIFTGDEMADGDKVIWRRSGEDDYTISSSGDKLDLSYGTYDRDSVRWEMIVGTDNQLASDNIIYNVKVEVTPSADWMVPTVYVQDSEGNRKKLDILEDTSYCDGFYGLSERSMEIYVPYNQWEYEENAYVSLTFNDSVFHEANDAHIQLYEGHFTAVSEAVSGTDITDKLFSADMTKADAGYMMTGEDEPWITMVMFDAEGNATGCLPFHLSLYSMDMGNDVYCRSNLLMEYEGRYININNNLTEEYYDETTNFIHTLYKGYAANRTYYQKMYYHKGNTESTFDVIAAYAGKYASIQEAEKAGAADIKDELFNSNYGYGADYSNGIFFTIFAGDDGTTAKETYHYFVKVVEGDIPNPLSSDTSISFVGLNDSHGNTINVHIIDSDVDSYAENNYLTMLVDEDVDLTNLAPVFYISNVAKLYAEGSNTPEVSGKSLHDFSKGPVQYSISAQDKIESRSIWLQIVKVGVGNGTLYINSLGDEKAKTKVEDGITYSTREMLIDGRYHYLHDIVLINLGDEEIPSISVDLVSDEVELDKYWTLNGDYPLPDISHGGTAKYGLWNLAKLRIRPKDGAADGRDITGTLTIKSGETALIVLTLTGTVGDPSITTKEIPQAVKYVPYGTMIQNSNKYSWNKVSYRLIDGKLPAGMEMKPNGELYGVPAEMGEFTFTVRMKNSYSSFSSSKKTFTLTVTENTDANVDQATDQGYDLTQRVQNMVLESAYDQTLVSQGVYDEFVDIFLDGVKLRKDVDYTSESGSTRITIRGETLKANNTSGRHTLGIEFRTGENKTLKRAAQNYENTTRNQSSNTSRHNKRRSIDLTSAAETKPQDAKKGYIDAQTGIITGEGTGYSKWQKDEMGWKLIYADGTVAGGSVIQLPDGTAAEQILWEQVNGAWYAFGITGYIKSGWVYDYQLNRWYCMTPENGMYTGWYGDAQDNCVYYLEPESGNLAVGWKFIDDKWYYFNGLVLIPTWNFNAITGEWEYNVLSGNKPYGAMYHNEQTPDGYFVGADGVWDGQEKE